MRWNFVYISSITRDWCQSNDFHVGETPNVVTVKWAVISNFLHEKLGGMNEQIYIWSCDLAFICRRNHWIGVICELCAVFKKKKKKNIQLQLDRIAHTHTPNYAAGCWLYVPQKCVPKLKGSFQRKMVVARAFAHEKKIENISTHSDYEWVFQLKIKFHFMMAYATHNYKTVYFFSYVRNCLSSYSFRLLAYTFSSHQMSHMKRNLLHNMCLHNYFQLM